MTPSRSTLPVAQANWPNSPVPNNHLNPVSHRTSYTLASTKGEYEQSFQLLYQEYVRHGYTCPCMTKMRYSIFNALKDTRTIIAKENDEVVGCATIIADSALGIPMDKEYNEELSQFRKEGQLIGEISGLAIDPKCKKYDMQILLKLIIYIVSVSRDMGIDRLCIAINPKHLTFYTRGFGAERVSLDSKPYRGANDAPSYALTMAVKEICNFFLGGKKKNFAYKMIQSCIARDSNIAEVFHQPSSNKKNIQRSAMSRECLSYFFAEKSNLFQNLTAEQLDYFFDENRKIYQPLMSIFLRQLFGRHQTPVATDLSKFITTFDRDKELAAISS